MSEAYKVSLANKILSQQANMTMYEVKNLSKMSETGRQAYTEAYATEAMANAKNNPGQAAASNYAGNLYKTNLSQQAALSKINEINSRIAALYQPYSK
jgi:hypothetical protein